MPGRALCAGAAAAALLCGASLSARAATEATETAAGTRPLVRIEVTSAEESLATVAPVVEGRLVDRLSHRPEFAIARDAPPAGTEAWRLRLMVTGLRYDVSSEKTRSRDADSSGGVVVDSVLLGTLEFDVALTPPSAASPVVEDSISVGARRTVKDAYDVERQRAGVMDDLLERASDRIGRLLKKKLKD